MVAGLTLATSLTVSSVRAATAAATATAGPNGGTAVEEVVVTAQRKSEASQTVPISISAFSEKTLEKLKIEGGPDLLKAIPNVSFTKTNFSGYNLTIRGIGTQALSVTTDPGVSVNFNGTALIRNRLFEQEFFDVERVEVLRGPQGTLYGRNATAGAVNVISAKPVDHFAGELKGEIGNYGDRRLSGFVNFPISGDKLDLRIAGSWTKRGGFDYNSETGNPIDGRDLYSLRVTLGFKPTERLKGNLVWEHFNENDSRARSTKQLCTRDPGPSSIGGLQNLDTLASAYLSQGCQDASLYTPQAYGTPNGLSIPFVLAAAQNTSQLGDIGRNGTAVTLLKPEDPYGGLMQSTDLRVIASQFDPVYRAKADIIELNFDYTLTDHLTLSSQTAYNHDQYFSQEDFNRFNTVPGVFNSSDGLYNALGGGKAPPIVPGGVYCDPQLGCSTSIVGLDQSNATSKQFSQEFRLQSSFSGPFNFSFGGNYLYYKTEENYYVFYNVLTAIAQSYGVGNNSAKYDHCNQGNGIIVVKPGNTDGCFYIDPNPLGKLNNWGHNYFLSQNPYSVKSGAVFGEMYYKVRPNLKLTAGFRYTDDNKDFTLIPSQALLSGGPGGTGGTQAGGYPVTGQISQHWGAATGRIGIDWTPTLSFTNQTLIYVFYNRGYKGGGANPPGIGYETTGYNGNPPPVILTTYPATFKPEYVNAFEVGTKNTLFGGSVVLNADAFFYDYKGYQVSQIEDRTAINENFNAHVWGAELDSVWRATHNLRFSYTMGYQGSRLASGSQSIDVMNRTQGNPDYVVIKGNELLPSNCVVSKAYITNLIAQNRAEGLNDYAFFAQTCPGTFISAPLPPEDFANGGVGFYANLAGHQLPNQPHFTEALAADYTLDLPWGWEGTIHGDVYHQTSSWARVYQDPIDKLNAWTNINLRLIIARPKSGLEFEIYCKNLLNGTPITGAFINSDDTALTTNVFTLDPRLIGASVRKRF